MTFGSLFTVLFNFLIGQEFRQAFQALPGGLWDPHHASNPEITAMIPLGYGQKFFEDNYQIVIAAAEATKDTEMVVFSDPTQLAESLFKRLNHHVLTIKRDYLAELMGSMLTTSSNSYESDLSALILEQVEEVKSITKYSN